MDNKQFIDILSERIGLDKESTAKVISDLSEIIADTVVDEDCVVVPSFGSFEPKKKLERVVVHPSTGKKILIPPRLTMGFKPSTMLRNDIK
ncbi:MAG: HU family DNA-binding protein [Bacteroidales bacterium]|nr:HU family DNA-binding protein [Bacteroidales bacterium]MDE6259113.1 HU family DNA-binding protein [Muribaculaceae bacterium]